MIQGKSREEILADQKQRVMNPTRGLPEAPISNRFSHISIMGAVADTSACGYYRVINPLHLLKLHGADAEYSSHPSMDHFLRHPRVLAPRQHSPDVYEILRMVPWEGLKVYYELDDDLDAVQPSSPAYITYHQGSPENQAIPKFMRNCHGMVTTTPEIARWYSQHNQNMAVIPNFIDFGFRDWAADVEYDHFGNAEIQLLPVARPAEYEDNIIVAWQGGTTHQEDLPLIGAVVKHLLDKYPNVHFAMYSSYPMFEQMIEEYKWNLEKVHYIPARHFMDHPEGLQGIDISLAPIACNQFNLAKSDLKILEGMAAGTAMVVSNVGPYARFNQRHPGMVNMVGKGHDCFRTWIEALEDLIDNPEKLAMRKEMGRQLIADQYSLEKNIHLWPLAWDAIDARVAEGKIGPPDSQRGTKFHRAYKHYGRNDACPCGAKKEDGSPFKYKKHCVDAWG